MFHLEYDVAPADIAAFRLHVAMRPAQRRAVVLRFLLLLLILPAGVALLTWVTGGMRPLRPAPGTVITAVLPSLLGLAVIPFIGMLRRSVARRSTASQLAGRAKDVLTGRMRMVVSEEGIAVASPGARSLYLWRVIEGVERTAAHLFILLGPHLAIVVPGRGLDAATAEGLQAALAAGIARRDRKAAQAVEPPGNDTTGRPISP